MSKIISTTILLLPLLIIFISVITFFNYETKNDFLYDTLLRNRDIVVDGVISADKVNNLKNKLDQVEQCDINIYYNGSLAAPGNIVDGAVTIHIQSVRPSLYSAVRRVLFFSYYLPDMYYASQACYEEK